MTQPTEPMTWENSEFDEEVRCTHHHSIYIPEWEDSIHIPRDLSGDKFIPVVRL
jgi:deoxycytidine triphosphate deaminase